MYTIYFIPKSPHATIYSFVCEDHCEDRGMKIIGDTFDIFMNSQID